PRTRPEWPWLVAGRLALGRERLGLADQHAARLRALVRRDDPAPLEHVDQSSRPRVADPQAALEQRDGRRLRLDDDLDRPLQQRILVRVELAVLVPAVLDRPLRRLQE